MSENFLALESPSEVSDSRFPQAVQPKSAAGDSKDPLGRVTLTISVGPPGRGKAGRRCAGPPDQRKVNVSTGHLH